MKDDWKRLEIIEGWLSMYHSNVRLRDLVIESICTLVVQQFRKDVFQAIKGEIRKEHLESALAGKVMLCKSSLEPILSPWEGGEPRQLHIADANRTKIRTVKQLVDFLWDFDDDHKRTQWANRSYRRLHQRALKVVQVHCGAEAAERVHDGIKRIFVLTNWVLPYPNETKFFRQGDFKQRLWMSICHRDWAGRRANEVIPFRELCAEMRDGKRKARYYTYGKFSPGYHRRVSEYMGGRWVLHQQIFPAEMRAIPGESEHFGHQSEVDMAAWGERLEQQWQAAVEE